VRFGRPWDTMAVHKKSIVLYASNKQLVMKNTTEICKEKLKKHMQDLYTENYRTLMAEIKALNKWGNKWRDTSYL